MFPLGDKFLCLLFPSYIRDINFCCGERTPGNLHLPPSPRLPPRLLTMFQLEHHCWYCNFPAPACVCTKPPPLPREAGTCPKHSSPAGLTPWEQPKPFATYPWQRRSKDTSTDELQNLGPHKDVPRDAPLYKSISDKLRLLLCRSNRFQPVSSSPCFFPDPQPHHRVPKEGAGRGGHAGKALGVLGQGLGALGWPAPHCTHTSKPQPSSPGWGMQQPAELPGQR